MKLLLDTCTFLWVVAGAPELSETASEEFLKEENEVYLSSVSAWEIAVKSFLGKLPLPEPPHRFVPRERERHGISLLALDEESALHVARLPELHKDPFDRMLVCQALVGGLAILTPDPDITRYPVRTLW